MAARKMSGRIETTEAEALWAEASRLRADYRNDVATLRALVSTCREEIEALKAENATLRSRLKQLENGGTHGVRA